MEGSMKVGNAVVLLAGLLLLDTAACSIAAEAESGHDTESVASELTTTYQAEGAFDIEEGVVETTNAGFTGTGYVNVVDAIDSRIWYVVNSPVTGRATLGVRYANGDTCSRPIQVVTNGSNGPLLSGAPTGAWTTWVTVTGTIDLGAGDNDLLLWSTVSGGLPNIDRLDITQPPVLGHARRPRPPAGRGHACRRPG
jgi:hypothetical protein